MKKDPLTVERREPGGMQVPAQGATTPRLPAFPWVAFGISIALTITIAVYVRRTLDARDQARFENAVQSTEDRIRQRLDTYVAVLNATSALYSANEDVSRAQFKAYAEGLSLRIRYPGIQALAYSVRTRAEEAPALVRRMREQGETAFQMWPATGEPETTTVVYIEPHDRRNLKVLGYDLSSESARRDGLFHARDSGQAAVTRRLTLVQEIDARKQPGFLILIPIYRGGQTPSTVDERRAALKGYVSCTFRATDLFERIFGTENQPRVDFAVYDQAPFDEAGLLYRSSPELVPPQSRPSRDAVFELGGSQWTLRFWARPESGPPLVAIILAIGGALSVALLLLIRVQVRGRHAAERAAMDLARSEGRLRTLIERAPVAMSVFREGRLVYVNPHMVETLGHDRAEDLVGKSLFDSVVPEDRPILAQAISAPTTVPDLGRGGTPVAIELRHLRRDGQSVNTEGFLLPILFDGEPAGMGVWQDTTQRKQLAAKMMQMDRMIAAGTLAAGVGHEINNPLSFVTANLAFATKRLPLLGGNGARTVAGDRDSPENKHSDVSEIAQALEDAQEGADRIRRIVRDLKVFSRVSEEKRGPVDVLAALDFAINVARNELRHRARLDCDFEAVPKVDADKARLGQVFINLLVNAAQAIPEGAADRNRIQVTTRCEPGPRVAVEIRDTGLGIRKEIMSRIFDPFFTTKPIGMGTGLGLSICQAIVTDLGGEIRVKSEVGVGTSVCVVLPASSESVQVSVPSGGVPVSSRRARILIVDDEALALRALERDLREDHEVVTESRAARALERVQSGERFDVIISDLMMPDMTGMELHARLMALAPDQARAMLFLTGGAFTAGAVEFLERTTIRHLGKPVDSQELRRLVRETVGIRGV
jgi:PAS domain S-box-containing protein